jgi:hypothetical protein
MRMQMNTHACPKASSQNHPGTSAWIPVISPTCIDSFHEVAGMWEQHEILILLADMQGSLPGSVEHLDSREYSQKNKYITRYARRRYAVSRTLAKHLLAAILYKQSPEDIILEKEHTGGIRVVGDDSVFLCISYAHNFIAFAIARSKVGIDIERIRPVAIHHIPSLVGTICGENPATTQDCTVFLRHWTELEAYAKYSNIPLWKMLQHPQARTGGHPRSFIIPGGVILSIVTEAPCAPDRLQCVIKNPEREGPDQG